MKLPRIGAHLVTPRAGYSHHGIYVGRRKVIHYSGLANGLAAGPIVETSLEEFSAGRGFKIKSYENPRFTGRDVEKRARSNLGENDYDLHANNCEHFCTWVIMGSPSSRQVDFVQDLLITNPAAETALRARQVIKQKHGRKEAAKQAASSAAVMVAAATVPLVGQVYLLHKLYKWMRK